MTDQNACQYIYMAIYMALISIIVALTSGNVAFTLSPAADCWNGRSFFYNTSIKMVLKFFWKLICWDIIIKNPVKI